MRAKKKKKQKKKKKKKKKKKISKNTNDNTTLYNIWNNKKQQQYCQNKGCEERKNENKDHWIQTRDLRQTTAGILPTGGRAKGILRN